jgi:hypothetical protein
LIASFGIGSVAFESEFNEGKRRGGALGHTCDLDAYAPGAQSERRQLVLFDRVVRFKDQIDFTIGQVPKFDFH